MRGGIQDLCNMCIDLEYIDSKGERPFALTVVLYF
jgi:hypothetical protein